MKPLVAIVLLASCDRILSLNQIKDPPPPPDAFVPVCLGRGLIADLCSNEGLPATVELSPQIDTDNCVAQTGGVQSMAPLACLVWGANVHGHDVIASGSVPLVIAATETLSIDGTLDVGGHVEFPGAGAAACTSGPFNGKEGSADAGGGGGGGGYRGGGGAGGTAADGGNGGGGATTTPAGLRGGCAGGKGGTSGQMPNMALGPPGGFGGGAVYLLATKLEITGAILAGGGGGYAGVATPVGGSGGGGGGLIALDAPEIDLDPAARLCANGGGGGGGGPANIGGDGENGADGCITNDPATGGDAGTGGGSGGAAAAKFILDGSMGASPPIDVGGAGGGGGGAGHIVYFDARPTSTNVSPAAD